MELSLPARDLNAGVVAFENGADSIYFGLERFSARASSVNFSLDDYRRIRKYAVDHNKRIFIAFNTILNDDELKEAFRMLSVISVIGCDGLLVQDWGIVRLVRKYFPRIPLHGSTQMAIQNSAAVSVLHKLGFERAVLARELSLEEIAQIRRANPDIELKVFVHGALCYCISGLCYASKMLMGKGSANRGGCVQACRFTYETPSGKGEKPFSLKDLESTREIIDRLAEIGIDSIKVEGRLKGESYVKWAARYYRALLNHDGETWTDECRMRMQSAYSRERSTGYFYEDDLRSGALALKEYQGHRGCVCGRFADSNHIMLSQSLSKHDGLMFIDSKGLPHKFANLKRSYKKNTVVELNSLTSERANVGAGSPLYRIKDSRDNMPSSFNPDSMDKQRIGLSVEIIVCKDAMRVSTVLPFGVAVDNSYPADILPARTIQNFKGLLSDAFNRKTEWCELRYARICNETESEEDRIFVPSSVMKRIAADFFSKCDSAVMEYANRPMPDENVDFECSTPAESVLSPVAFGRPATDASSFRDKILEVNNISDFDCLLDDSGEIPQNLLRNVKGVVIGPYMNVANRQAVLFFKDMLGNKLAGAVSFVEGGISEDLKVRLIDGQELFSNRNMPFCIKREADGRFLQVRALEIAHS